MRSFCIRFLKICFLSFLAVHADATIISGSNHVSTGSTVTYTASSWSIPLANATVLWSVTGGTIVSQNGTTCTVHWTALSGIWGVTVTETTFSIPQNIASNTLNVQIGSPTVSVTPTSILIDYGSFNTAFFTGTVSSVDLVLPGNMKWQSSSDGLTWTDITPAATGHTYTPTAVGLYYRMAALDAGVYYYSNAVSYNYTPLTAGAIGISTQPAAGTVPVISAIPATGGTCGPNTVYTWEQSVDGGPWTSFTSNSGVLGDYSYPSYSIVTGDTYLRRKVTCNGVTLTSNTIHITPTYTSVDHENQNYVRTIDVHVPGFDTWYDADQLPIDSKSESTTYLDGLGRPIQKVNKAASYYNNAWVDLVQPLEYDAAGRTVKKYLPYPTTDNPGKYKSANVSTQQASFVTAKFNEPAIAPTYASVQYDNSPLNLTTATFAPGQSWGGNAIGQQMNYDFNTADENVHIWTLSYSVTAIPTTSATATYGTGNLFKTTATDEKGKTVITYTDFSGNVVLKKVQDKNDAASGLTNQHAGWACTYYIYDDLNHLRFTITPKAVAFLDGNSWTLTQQLVNDLCFVYSYDAKGRTISKKQPGAGELDIIYDQRDRAVFTQDANGKVATQWQGILYDALDRATSTGILQQNITATSLQSYVDINTGNATIVSRLLSTGAMMPAVVTDLSVSTRVPGTTEYIASNSITFQSGFSSETAAQFIAHISQSYSGSINEVVGVTDNPVPSGTFTTLTQTFYDNYLQASKSYTPTETSLTDPYIDPQVLAFPAQATPQIRGMATTMKVKNIINPADLTQGNWMETDNYYDDHGRLIQILNDNAIGGTDITTSRFDFEGKLWNSSVKHMAGATSQFTIVTKNTYDTRGHLVDVSKNFNNTFLKDLASYTYDEYGKLSNKRLAPGYTGSGKNEMESLTYDYNIQGWLTGINKTYALSTNNYDQWSQYFGLYLGYDNRDNTFTASQFNGSITGVIWKSQGDNAMRKYDYTYDNLGRFTTGSFLQRKDPSGNWSSSDADFSETVSYKDGNGNIGAMKRMGIIPGTMGGVVVDDLSYTYGTSANPNVNQLTRVDDANPLTSNGQLGDFKDGTNVAGSDDYAYDLNGNLVQDLNKGIANGGVIYNYLNKPVKITIPNKSIIEYTYDATGTKLSKKVTNLSVTPNTISTTQYASEFVYQDNLLQYVLHEEGRLKIITPSATGPMILNAGTAGANNVLPGQQGAFEYFIKDQLSNTRLMLTEEVQKETYIASMELTSSSDPNLGTDEAKLFGKIDPTTKNPTADNELILTRDNTPSTLWTSNTSAKVTHLTATYATKKMGPNMILKVSAGDMISAGTNYFYYTDNPSGPPDNSLNDALTSMMGALLGANPSSLAGIHSSAIQTNLSNPSGDLSGFMNTLPNSGPDLSAPKAYLNIVFFDEQFNFIPPDQNATSVGSAVSRVYSPNDQNAFLSLMQKAPKNGWVFIYLSNESNQDVYFDNFSVSQDHGRISDENHYYAFGQKIAGLRTSAFNNLIPNKYNYQGDYSEDEDNTGWNEFDLRMYDPQIGRWTGVDPYDEFASPYIGMGDDPINSVDPDGGGTDNGFLPSRIDFNSADFGNSIIAAFLDGGALSDIPTFCLTCEVANNVKTLAEVSVVAHVSESVAMDIEIKESEEFVTGIFSGIKNSVVGLFKNAIAYSQPWNAMDVMTPQEYINFLGSSHDPIQDAFDFGDMITDPTGVKQNKYFSDLYNNFKYSTPGEKGSKLGQGIVIVGSSFLGDPEVGAETGIAEEGGLVGVQEQSSGALTSYYPANGGALGQWGSEYLMAGTEIDRYGSGFGKYFSPRGIPNEMRALPPGNTGAYNAFRVVKPFEVQSSTIAPAFGKIGLGTQYLSPVSMNVLLKRGIIVPIP